MEKISERDEYLYYDSNSAGFQLDSGRDPRMNLRREISSEIELSDGKGTYEEYKTDSSRLQGTKLHQGIFYSPNY